MLNVNTVPESIFNFVKNFDKQRPTVEALNQWWLETSKFIADYPFPLPEMEKKFNETVFNPLRDSIDKINQGTTTPLLDILSLRRPLENFIRRILESEFDFNTAKQFATLYDQTILELTDQTVVELLEVIAKLSESIAETNPLQRDYLNHIPNSLTLIKERLLFSQVNGSVLQKLATVAAQIKIAQTSSVEDLTILITDRYKQPFSENLTVEEMTEQGYRVTLVKLDYLSDLIKEFKSKPRKVKSPYTNEEILEIQELAKDKLEFLRTAYPGKIYSHVENMVNAHVRSNDPREADFSYAETKEGLKEHYHPMNEAVQLNLSMLHQQLLDRRNIATDKTAFKFFNVLIGQIEENSNNYCQFASKKSWKHTRSITTALTTTAKMLLLFTDEEIATRLDALPPLV